MENKKDVYFIAGVAELSGTTTKQIREWTKHGYLGEVSEVNWGKKKAAIYNEHHIERAKTIVKYKESGYTLQAAVMLMQEELAE